jgi:hypothetical protein
MISAVLAGLIRDYARQGVVRPPSDLRRDMPATCRNGRRASGSWAIRRDRRPVRPTLAAVISLLAARLGGLPAL